METAPRLSTISKEALESQLQKSYLKLVEAKTKEYIEKRLQARLVISFDKGKIMSIQDQAIIAGGSVVDFYLQKVLS